MRRNRILMLLLLITVACSASAFGTRERLKTVGLSRIEQSVVESINNESRIRIEGVSAAIRINNDGKRGQISATLTGFASVPAKLQVTTSGSGISLYVDWQDNTSISTRELTLEVFLPPTYRGDLTVSSVSGEIDIPEFSLSSLNVISTSGAIGIDRIQTRNLYVKNTSGSIKAGSIEASEADIKTVSGSVLFSGDIDKDARFTSISGRTRVAGTFRTLDLQSSSGAIDLALSGQIENLSAVAISGDISITLNRGQTDLRGTASSVSGKVAVDLDGARKEVGLRSTSFVSGDQSVIMDCSTVSGSIKISQ